MGAKSWRRRPAGGIIVPEVDIEKNGRRGCLSAEEVTWLEPAFFIELPSAELDRPRNIDFARDSLRALETVFLWHFSRGEVARHFISLPAGVRRSAYEISRRQIARDHEHACVEALFFIICSEYVCKIIKSKPAACPASLRSRHPPSAD